MNIVSDLSDPVDVYQFTDSAKLIFQEKLSKGVVMIDLGVWKKWTQDSAWHKGRRGRYNSIFIEKSKLKEIWPKIKELLDK